MPTRLPTTEETPIPQVIKQAAKVFPTARPLDSDIPNVEPQVAEDSGVMWRTSLRRGREPFLTGFVEVLGN